jgi:hypothetical protein
MKLLFAAIIALALTTPAWAGKHCWTQCRSDGSGFCETNCD